MKSIFIPLCILLCLLIIISFFGREYFVAPLDPAFIEKYNQFIEFYNPFMENWTTSITNSLASDTKVKPASSPTSNATSTSPPQPTNAEMNTYIQTLSTKEKKPFPPITDPFPTISTAEDLIPIQSQMPKDSKPFKNALDWMNSNLVSSHEKVEGALSAIGNIQGFEDICQQITTCQQTQTTATTQDMTSVFSSFDTDELRTSLQKNKTLIAKSKDLQNKAQNGSLVPSAPKRVSPYRMPGGSDKLQRMKEDDPEQYKKYEKNNKVFFDMKTNFDQINGSLR